MTKHFVKQITQSTLEEIIDKDNAEYNDVLASAIEASEIELSELVTFSNKFVDVQDVIFKTSGDVLELNFVIYDAEDGSLQTHAESSVGFSPERPICVMIRDSDLRVGYEHYNIAVHEDNISALTYLESSGQVKEGISLGPGSFAKSKKKNHKKKDMDVDQSSDSKQVERVLCAYCKRPVSQAPLKPGQKSKRGECNQCLRQIHLTCLCYSMKIDREALKTNRTYICDDCYPKKSGKECEETMVL